MQHERDEREAAPDGGRGAERGDPAPTPPWPCAWAELARAAHIEPGEALVLALSGGADSVFLLHLLSRADPRPNVTAVHVQHGLRGAESREDADFCRGLCADLGVPFRLRELELAR